MSASAPALLLVLLKITGPKLFGPYFSVSALVIKQGRKSPPTVTPDRRLEQSAVRPDSQGFGAGGSFLQCALASTFRERPDPVPHNGPRDAELSRSAGRADGQSPRWFACVPGAAPSGDTRSRRCFL